MLIMHWVINLLFIILLLLVIFSCHCVFLLCLFNCCLEVGLEIIPLVKPNAKTITDWCVKV